MGGYIPTHSKKKDRLAKLEAELRRMIACGVEREKLLAEALEIRDARIRVLKSKQNQNPERNPSERGLFEKDQRAINALKERTAESILNDYCRQET